LIVALNGLLVIFVVSSEIIRKRIATRREIAEMEIPPPGPSTEGKEATII
jgi:hypothetical protein